METGKVVESQEPGQVIRVKKSTSIIEKQIRDYSLLGAESQLAVDNGLAGATWYTTPIPREKMKELLVRRNGPAIRDTLLWFGLLFGSGYLFFYLWGTWWAALPYFVYSVIYASSSDSRWHESSHGTAFKSDWMNNVLYEIASFMVFRQSVPWRYSHARHHSDTIIRGRDPEIAVPRPPDIKGIILNLFMLKHVPAEGKKLLRHFAGKIDPEVATYVPKFEHGKVFLRARIYVLIFLIVIGLSIYFQSILPLMFIGLPTFLGSWLMPIYGLTQHAGLAENVLDHRLNCRTVYMNRIHRYLYWNMNYHVEHHMFPLVPYHALPKLHNLMKHDCPKPYNGLIETYKEIIPALLRQVKDPSYHVTRKIPTSSLNQDQTARNFVKDEIKMTEDGLVEVCAIGQLQPSDVLRVDYQNKTYAVYRTQKDKYYATDGICTHGNTHLSDGLVIGDQVECPKHNGRFNVTNGNPERPPVCVGLKTYPVLTRDGKILIDVNSSTAKEQKVLGKSTLFTVVSNNNVSTYIKELVLKPTGNIGVDYQPGEYVQFEIPPYELNFEKININEPYIKTWQENNLFKYRVKNNVTLTRNYSMASNPGKEKDLRFNVRIALPPAGMNFTAGIGSSYVFNLKAGDTVKVYGPFGDFHVKDSQKEMVYVGGGAGMAPLRSHLSYLLETIHSGRKISLWYGARSEKELFYQDYFEKLAKEHQNFTFQVAFSEPGHNKNPKFFNGFIHEVLKAEFLDKCKNPRDLEYYLCGPPAMISVSLSMLDQFGIAKDQVSFDEF